MLGIVAHFLHIHIHSVCRQILTNLLWQWRNDTDVQACLKSHMKKQDIMHPRALLKTSDLLPGTAVLHTSVWGYILNLRSSSEQCVVSIKDTSCHFAQ